MRAMCMHGANRRRNTKRVLKSGQFVTYCIDCKAIASRKSNLKKQGYNPMWEAQRGLCAFCGQPLADDNTTHWEHNHATGAPRGLVHARCNQVIAGVEDAVALVGMDRLLAYLAK